MLLLITGGVTIFFLTSGDDGADSASITAVPAPEPTSGVPEDDNSIPVIAEKGSENQSSTQNVSDAPASGPSQEMPRLLYASA